MKNVIFYKQTNLSNYIVCKMSTINSAIESHLNSSKHTQVDKSEISFNILNGQIIKMLYQYITSYKKVCHNLVT